MKSYNIKKRFLLGLGGAGKAAPCGSFFLFSWPERPVSFRGNVEDGATMLFPALSYHKPEHRFRDFSPSIFHQHSSLLCAGKLPSDVWTVAFAKGSCFFSDSVQSNWWPHCNVFHVWDTNSLKSRTSKWQMGRPICICTLKTSFFCMYPGATTIWAVSLSDLFIQFWKLAWKLTYAAALCYKNEEN